MATSNPVRTYILTGSVAAITATGAWYGAGLKTRQEHSQVGRLFSLLLHKQGADGRRQERKVAMQASPAERIDQMETAKARLLSQRAELQAKIDRLTTEKRPSATSEDTNV